MGNMKNTLVVILILAMLSMFVPIETYASSNSITFDNFVIDFTSNTVPTVVTGSSSSVTSTSATLRANVTSDGGDTITARGIEYKINGSGEPYTAVTASTVGTGEYSIDLTGLTPNTTYDVRAYATNSQGTSYGGVNSFTTLSNNADLSALSLSSGSLDPVFDSGTTGYTASVGNEVSSITITPIVSDATATVTVNGSAVVSGTASEAINLQAGPNPISVVVTAEDGTTKPYMITISRAELAATSVSVPINGTYIAGQTLSFIVYFDNAVSVTGTPYIPITLDIGGTVNATYFSGSGSYALTFGYTVEEGNHDSNGISVGSAISLNGSTIHDSEGNNVNLTLNNVGDTSAVLVDAVPPTVTDTSISISGATGTGGTFKIGDTVTATWNDTAGGDNNNDISNVTVDFSEFGGGSSVVATNSSGTWTATYTVVAGSIEAVNRNVSVTAEDFAGNRTTTADTSNATVDNFAPRVTSVNVPASGTYIADDNLYFTVNFNKNVHTAFETPYISIIIGTDTVNAYYISGSGTSALLFGYTVQQGDLDLDGIVVVNSNSSTVMDTAGNITTLTLNAIGNTSSVLVDAVLSDNADLSALSLSNGTLDPVFASGTTGYTAGVANAVTSITVTPTVADATATVTVNGDAVVSGNSSELINLNVGVNTITVVVTAQDGSTKTYTVVVNRAESSNADLSALSLSDGTLDPVFASGTTGYTASVGNAVTSITVTPTVADGTATVTVNGVGVTSGQASGAINLNVGENTITVFVTAEDGTTTKTYTVTVTRPENLTYTVVYKGNGSTAGSVPLDSISYEEGESITVLENTGNLERTGYTFAGWNTQADGSGTNYLPGSTFAMGTENVTLYAKWIDLASIRMTANPDNVKGNNNFNQTFTLNLYNDTVTGSVYREDINLGGVFSTLNISSVSNSSNTVTLAVYGSLNTQGIGTIALDQNKLNNSTTPLTAEVVVSLNTVAYHGNGNTGGSVPTDSNTYEDGATVTVRGNTGNLVRTGYRFAGWNTQANGQGTSYTQGSTLIMGTTNVNLYGMWIKIPSGGGSSGGGTGGDTISAPTPAPSTETEVVVIVNGEEQTAGKETVIEQGGEKIVELRVDSSVLSQKIDKVISINQSEDRQGQNLIEIPVAAQGVNQIRSILTGDIVKNMEDNQFTLVINTEKVNYVIPAKEIAIEKVAAILNVAPTSLQQIEIELRIIHIDEIKVNEITQRGRDQGIEVIVQPVEFQLVAKTTSTTGEVQETTVNQFSSYVSRVMEIPQGVDPSKITTGIIYNADGTFTHIPTTAYMENEKWYAKLNSLTNSSYSVIWNPITVASVENHWSKKAVNDMASRLIIKNPKTFNPQGYITRGEFAEYITKALGIYRTGVVKVGNFADVEVANELADAIEAATEYGIIKGYPDGTFRPDAKISREEAMVMYAKAMDIVGLKEIDNRRIENYKDKEEIADWAYEFVKKTVSTGIFNGRTAETINPKDTFTYAEAATAIRNLLVRAGLIND